MTAAAAAPALATLASQLLAAGLSSADVATVLKGQGAFAAPPTPGTPPGFNRNLVASILAGGVSGASPEILAALRGKLPETSDAPGSKAILSEDLIPRLIEQERARQRFGRFFGLDSGPSAEDVYGQIREGRRSELEELGARERALKALEGQIQAAIRQMELGAGLKQTELQVGGDIKRQELSSLGDIQRQRVQSGYSTAQGLLNTAIQNMTAPQNLAQSSVLQQLATQVS